ncbi:MAG: hypothetical protein R3B09_01730 [Nannocystaceae bacterium]
MIELVPDSDGVFRPKEKIHYGWWIAGGVATVGVLGAGAYFLMRKPKAEGEAGVLPAGDGGTGDAGDAGTNGNGGGAPAVNTGQWTNVRPLPTAADVPGFDLAKNWGKTPAELRPLFAQMETASGIKGAARLFAVFAKRESGFVASAHNDSSGERTASRNAYKNAKGNNPPLKYGDQAGEFGSGGLFAALGPYFLWTGVQEMGANAPLLGSPPEIMFLPRVAAFGACVFLQRLLDNYRIDDHADLKVGWANPSLLKSGRGGSTYQAVRARFLSDAKDLQVDLQDTATIPATLSAKSWPGVSKVFAQLVGTLPTPAGG